MTSPKDSKLIRNFVWAKDPRRYFSDCLKIQPKTGTDNVFLEPNKHQAVIQDTIDDQRRRGVPVRIMVLKPRQTGSSTISCANLFHQVRFIKGLGMVVSMDFDSAEHIFGINQRFYHYLPASEKEVLKLVASNRKELKFAEPHGGRIAVETAGKASGGHSFTIRHLLLSEVSRWPVDCEDTRVGLLNAVPREADTTVIIESVANGMSGWFWQEWNKKDSDYVKIFLPWFAHDEYRKELPIEASLYETTLSPEELRLIGQFNLALEQLEWRRWAIRNNCNDDVEKFKEQYPATAREAFISSGNTFFHIPTLEEIATSNGMRCDLRETERPDGHKEITPLANPRGLLVVWKRPELGHSYAIGSDVAEGIEIEGAPAYDIKDYSSADVIDRHTGEQAAQLHGHLTPDEFGRQLALLACWYNRAFVGVESNGGYGAHTMDSMQQAGHPLGLLYKPDNRDKLGFCTTPASKKSILSKLDMALRKGELIVSSEETVNELRSFVQKPDGRLEGGSGNKDDRVMSLAIAYQMMIVAPATDFYFKDKQVMRPASYKPYKSIYAPSHSASTRLV